MVLQELSLFHFFIYHKDQGYFRRDKTRFFICDITANIVFIINITILHTIDKIADTDIKVIIAPKKAIRAIIAPKIETKTNIVPAVSNPSKNPANPPTIKPPIARTIMLRIQTVTVTTTPPIIAPMGPHRILKMGPNMIPPKIP